MERSIQMMLKRFWQHAASALVCLIGSAAWAQTPPVDVSTPVTTPTVLIPAAAPAPAPEPIRNLEPTTLPAAPVTAAEIVAYNDLWDRIRRGFRMNDLSNEVVSERERLYARDPAYMRRMSERGSKYLFHIVEELERRNMPMELALLPFVESAFVVNAVSSARAAGMWQFIPGTGRDFDLKQNLFRDDRRDVQASTRAALDYLTKLHNMFGDWHLALAAYNWGEGSVGRAIKRNQAAGLGTSYWDLNMPLETRHYVPKLQAIKNIVANPAAFNIELPRVDNHPFFQSVAITRDIDVALAARLANVSLEEFRSLNPSANKPVILAAGQSELLLPWANAETFRTNLANHSGQLASWTAWTAPRQMRPEQVAQEVGMGLEELRSINRIPPRHSIRAGSTLLVPRGSRTQDVSGNLADNAQLALQADPVKVCKTVRVKRKTRQVCNWVIPGSGRVVRADNAPQTAKPAAVQVRGNAAPGVRGKQAAAPAARGKAVPAARGKAAPATRGSTAGRAQKPSPVRGKPAPTKPPTKTPTKTQPRGNPKR
jgi:membrane-bound lytic murein transglycosylase D